MVGLGTIPTTQRHGLPCREKPAVTFLSVRLVVDEPPVSSLSQAEIISLHLWEKTSVKAVENLQDTGYRGQSFKSNQDGVSPANQCDEDVDPEEVPAQPPRLLG